MDTLPPLSGDTIRHGHSSAEASTRDSLRRSSAEFRDRPPDPTTVQHLGAARRRLLTLTVRFLRAAMSAVVATLPVLVILLIPTLVRGDTGAMPLTGIGGTLLNGAFIAAVILIPMVNGWLDPEVPDWTSTTAMATTGRVWRTRIWLALLAVLALLGVFAVGQTAAYFLSRSSPAIIDGVFDYSRFLAPELVVYLLGYVLSLTSYILLIRLLARRAD